MTLSLVLLLFPETEHCFYSSLQGKVMMMYSVHYVACWKLLIVIGSVIAHYVSSAYILNCNENVTFKVFILYNINALYCKYNLLENRQENNAHKFNSPSFAQIIRFSIALQKEIIRGFMNIVGRSRNFVHRGNISINKDSIKGAVQQDVSSWKWHLSIYMY